MSNSESCWEPPSAQQSPKLSSLIFLHQEILTRVAKWMDMGVCHEGHHLGDSIRKERDMSPMILGPTRPGSTLCPFTKTP